jgi:uncharacterized membrane protein
MNVVVVVLALLGIGAAVGHYLMPPYNPGFARFPAITDVHVVLGAVYLGLAPLQFLRPLRARWPAVHRWLGRSLVGIGLVIGLSALFLGFVVPMSGNPERVVIGAFGGLFLASLVLSVVRIRERRVAEHREWMIRAFAIGLSIATMRLIFIPALMVVGNPTEQQVAVLSVSSFAIAFAIHALVAEWWIRRTRPMPRRAAPLPKTTTATIGAGAPTPRA